jgi:hypothetical protein
VVNPGVNGYSHIGCYTEVAGRTLPTGRDVTVKTVANCISACKTGSFKYCGLEYGGECWMGNAIAAGSVVAPAKECNVACANNATELCGGGSRLNIYQLNDGSISSTSGTPSSTVSTGVSITSSSASATATGPAVRQTVGKYTFEGCYVEPATGGRAIEEKGTANSAMTLEMCASFCDGYKYFGTEYSSECFCGNTVRSASVPAKSVTECSALCSGDPLTYCGGGSRLSLYKLTAASGGSSSVSSSATASTSGSASVSGTVSSSSASASPTGPSVKPVVSGQWQSKGCYVESTGGKALSKSTFADDNMTLESCATFCKGSKFFATEYGRECYCGDSLRQGSVPATKQTECNMLCAGDKSSYCGAGDRMQLYELTSSTTSSSATASGTVSSSAASSSAPTSTSASASASPSATGPSVKPTVSNQWQSKGCYVESTGGKALSKSTFADDKMTLESCAAFCKGSKFFATEYGRECYCGDSLREGAAPATKQTDCNMLCPGDSNYYCGAGDRLQLYEFTGTSSSSSATVSNAPSSSATSASASVSNAASSSSTSTSASPSSTGPAVKPTISNQWYSKGCYVESTGGKALSKSTFANDSMTLEACATFCKGSKYLGVEYGRECYCGDSLREGAVPATKQSDCNFPCPGDKTSLCGAGDRLQLYEFGEAPKSTASVSAATVSASAASRSSSATGPSSSSAVAQTTSTASSSSAVSSSATSSSVASTSKASSSSAVSSSAPSSSAASTSKASSSSVAASSAAPSSVSSSSATSSSAKPSTTSATSTTLSTSTKASTSSAQPSATGPVIWQGNSNFTYYACVKEPSAGRLLPTQVFNDGKLMTNKLCAEKCWQYNYSGVQYSQECWCGNTLNWAGNTGATPAKNVTNSECSLLCPGDNKSFCGAGSRLSLYINKKIVGTK